MVAASERNVWAAHEPQEAQAGVGVRARAYVAVRRAKPEAAIGWELVVGFICQQ